MTRMQLVRTLAAWRPDLTAYRDVESAYRISLKSLARRYLELHDEIADLDAMIGAIVDELAPDLIARNSIGHAGAAQLLLTAGDNPERLRSEASFAALCGVSPVPASSGKTTRHRLNRGGDRAANSALHIIAIGRLRTDPRTKAYVAKRIAEGHSKLEAIRCLKRYIAREVFTPHQQRQKEINQARHRRLTNRRASGARNTSRFATPSASPMQASSPRSAASATATTTPWPRRSTASTRPRSSSARTLALAGDRRVRHAGMGGLVQQSPAAGAHRQHPAGRRNATTPARTRHGGVT